MQQCCASWKRIDNNIRSSRLSAHVAKPIQDQLASFSISPLGLAVMQSREIFLLPRNKTSENPILFTLRLFAPLNYTVGPDGINLLRNITLLYLFDVLENTAGYFIHFIFLF